VFAESQDTTRTTVVDVLCVQPTAVTILAGTTEPGFANGVLSETHNNLLNFPQGIMQPDANTLLIADRSNGLVRKFNLKNNELSTFAGAGAYVEGALLDGAAPVSIKAAQLIAPSSLCADPTDKNSVFVASDDVQKVIRLISGDGNVKIVAGSVDGREPDPEDQTAMTAWVEKCLEPVTTALQATFSDIACVLPAKLNGTEEELIYMSCMSSNCIRSYNPRTGILPSYCWVLVQCFDSRSTFVVQVRLRRLSASACVDRTPRALSRIRLVSQLTLRVVC
jgi:hypothetical protein